MLLTALRQWQLRAETGFNDNSLTTLVVGSTNPVPHALVFRRLIEDAVLTIEVALCTLLGNRLLRLISLGHRCLWCCHAVLDRRRSTRLAVIRTSGQCCDRTCT